jgi:hypothetical protein
VRFVLQLHINPLFSIDKS